MKKALLILAVMALVVAALASSALAGPNDDWSAVRPGVGEIPD